MPHHNSIGEKSNNAWQSQQLSQQITKIATEEDEAGLFDGRVEEGFVDFKNVCETEAKKQPQHQAKNAQVQEAKENVHDHSKSTMLCWSTWKSPRYQGLGSVLFWTEWSPRHHLSRLLRIAQRLVLDTFMAMLGWVVTFIKETAATVSVAHKMALSMSSSEVLRTAKK